ncbi:MAG TPA: DUF47 family protein [Longimicrobium sp.]|nr:DUF47 family protein [Longimicrobium sp.]
MRLFVKLGRFYDAFSGMATRASEAARLLERLFAERQQVAEILEELARVDGEAAALRSQVVEEIESVAVTPLAREDVHKVGSMLYEMVHRFCDIARRTQPLHLGPTQPAALRLSGVLVRAAECIETSVASFRQRNYPTARCTDLERINDEGDAIYASAVEALFEGAPDPLEVLRWKEVYDQLQQALEHCQALDHALDGIVLDNRG